MSLSDFLSGGTAQPSAIRAELDDLSEAQRLGVCLALSAAQQKRLWQVASSVPRTPGGELVTEATAVFAGKNSLRAFSRFEKWFARLDGRIVGCNRHALSVLIGPGYFTVRGGGGDSSAGLELDYGEVPVEAPPGWPPVRDNGGGLARPVYGDLLDRLVWVARDVLIGAAFRRAVALDSYFVLVRKTG